MKNTPDQHLSFLLQYEIHSANGFMGFLCTFFKVPMRRYYARKAARKYAKFLQFKKAMNPNYSLTIIQK